MQPVPLDVDVEALRNIGTEVANAAATLRSATQDAGSGLAPAPGSGSAAAIAAQTAEQAWLADLRRLTDRIAGFGASLSTAARAYRADDQANAAALRRSGSRVPQ